MSNKKIEIANSAPLPNYGIQKGKNWWQNTNWLSACISWTISCYPSIYISNTSFAPGNSLQGMNMAETPPSHPIQTSLFCSLKTIPSCIVSLSTTSFNSADPPYWWSTPYACAFNFTIIYSLLLKFFLFHSFNMSKPSQSVSLHPLNMPSFLSKSCHVVGILIVTNRGGGEFFQVICVIGEGFQAKAATQKKKLY